MGERKMLSRCDGHVLVVLRLGIEEHGARPGGSVADRSPRADARETGAEHHGATEARVCMSAPCPMGSPRGRVRWCDQFGSITPPGGGPEAPKKAVMLVHMYVL